MLSIINEGACGNGITKIKDLQLLMIYPAAFALKHLVKDLGLKDAGLDSPLIHPLYSYFSAQQEGLGEQDVMQLLVAPEKRLIVRLENIHQNILFVNSPDGSKTPY
jgi:3-hydroxyisobutyrate dehydrogenase